MTSPAARKPGLSVFFPAYNDAGTIASLVISALRTARTLTDDYEVIVVNDGSADATAEILNELARTYLLRNFLADMPPVEAMEFLIERMKRTKNNKEFFSTMNQ